MEKFSKIHKNYREMVFKDCTAERDCKFLLKISSRLYKIVKSCRPLTLPLYSYNCKITVLIVSLPSKIVIQCKLLYIQ